jgi:predicted RNase H-like nuclease (RuvC/YqgF family)
MHAKMTRDRKKCFVASLKRVISKLEEENQSFRDLLERSQEEKNKYKDTHEDIDDRKPGSIGKNSPLTPNLKENSTALMSISNSRIFTVG